MLLQKLDSAHIISKLKEEGGQKQRLIREFVKHVMWLKTSTTVLSNVNALAIFSVSFFLDLWKKQPNFVKFVDIFKENYHYLKVAIFCHRILQEYRRSALWC